MFWYFTQSKMAVSCLRCLKSHKNADLKAHILCSITFPPKIVPLVRYCGKIYQSQTGYRRQYRAFHNVLRDYKHL